MTDTQLYLAIGVPVLFNGVMMALLSGVFSGRLGSLESSVNARFSSFESNMNARFSSLETRLEILTGKVAELADRLARLEERVR